MWFEHLLLINFFVGHILRQVKQLHGRYYCQLTIWCHKAVLEVYFEFIVFQVVDIDVILRQSFLICW